MKRITKGLRDNDKNEPDKEVNKGILILFDCDERFCFVFCFL